MATVTVKFNCSNNTWEFSPNDGNVNVPNGQSNVPIEWNLEGKHKPSGTTVKFADSGGIAFKSSNVKAWPGSTPTMTVGDPSQYTCTDDNSDANDVGDYAYAVNIVVTDSNGTQTTYSYDPDVQNDSSLCVTHGAPAAG